MFTWLNRQGVQCDKGFVVQSVARFSIEYRESGKTISVYVEDGTTADGRPCVGIKSTSFERWDGDPSSVVLPPEKQKELLANFTEALEFQGLAVEIY